MVRTRTERLVSSVAMSYVAIVVGTVAGLVVTPIIYNRLGTEGLSLWLVGTQLLGWLFLVDLGVSAIVPRLAGEMFGNAQRTGDSANTALTELFWKALRISLFQIPVITLVALGAWWCIPASWEPVRPSIELVLVAYVVLSPWQVLVEILRGSGEIVYLAKVQLVVSFARPLVLIVLVVAGWHFEGLAISLIIERWIQILAALVRIRRRYPHLLQKPTDEGSVRTMYLIERGVWLSVARVANQVRFGSDLVLLKAVAGEVAVVAYGCTGKLAQVLATQPALVLGIASPMIAELRTSAAERVRTACLALLRIVLVLSGAMGCLVLGVNRSFVDWWIGPEVFGGAILTAAFVLQFMLKHWRHSFATALLGLGQERTETVVALGDGALFVVLGLSLAAWYGAVGMAAGMVLAMLLFSLPWQLNKLSKECHVPRLYWVTENRDWFWRFALGASWAVGLAWWWTPTSFIGIGMQAGLSVVPYGLLVLPMLWRDPLVNYTRPWLDRLERAVLSVWRPRERTPHS